MKPSDYYQHDLAQGKIIPDAQQDNVLQALDALYEALQHPSSASSRPSGLKRFFKTSSPSPKGLYLFGPVGRGKTYLMDLFYKSLSIPKLRRHFYEFMADIHAELKRYQGSADPLKKIAEDLAKKTKVLCFDEFFVEDIADAMILGNLFQALFEAHLVIVATSNVAPQDLYKEGLQRDRFLPTIILIEKHMDVMALQNVQDYRLIKELREHRYHFPLQDAQAFLEAQFHYLNADHPLLSPSFELNHRPLEAVKRSATVIWFEFETLCENARSSQDYLKLCAAYKVILINHIPLLNEAHEAAARRFISLVDTCYDQHVLLILAAAVPLDQLYQGQRLHFEFERTKSRIVEMQSWDVN